jgi:hypothetical protein
MAGEAERFEQRLNSVALAFLAADLGFPRDILRAALYAFDSRIRSRRRSPSPSGICDVAGCV